MGIKRQNPERQTCPEIRQGKAELLKRVTERARERERGDTVTERCQAVMFRATFVRALCNKEN